MNVPIFVLYGFYAASASVGVVTMMMMMMMMMTTHGLLHLTATKLQVAS